ncbi:MAG: hypothetical protein MMC33_010214, partial [Icmadophila ericetorum]|nr:hypothetical protein [Icmadophila ericetorum]
MERGSACGEKEKYEEEWTISSAVRRRGSVQGLQIAREEPPDLNTHGSLGLLMSQGHQGVQEFVSGL